MTGAMTRDMKAHSQLLSALASLLGSAPTQSRMKPWHSACFSGARHIFHFENCDASHDLCDHDFALPGHIVVDVAVIVNHPDEAVVEVLCVVET